MTGGIGGIRSRGMKIQVVWWMELPRFHWGKYPPKGSEYYKLSKKPMFWGLYLGIVEFRFWSVAPKEE